MYIGTATSDLGDKINIYDLEALKQVLNSDKSIEFAVCTQEPCKLNKVKHPNILFLLSEDYVRNTDLSLDTRRKVMSRYFTPGIDRYIIKIKSDGDVDELVNKADRIASIYGASYYDSIQKNYSISGATYFDSLMLSVFTSVFAYSESVVIGKSVNWFKDNVLKLLRDNDYFLRFVSLRQIYDIMTKHGMSYLECIKFKLR